MKLVSTLGIIQLVLSLMLISAVLLQQRGVGLSATFGGEGNIYRTKRGIEKALFLGTIILSVLFFGISLATFIVAR